MWKGDCVVHVLYTIKVMIFSLRCWQELSMYDLKLKCIRCVSGKPTAEMQMLLHWTVFTCQIEMLSSIELHLLGWWNMSVLPSAQTVQSTGSERNLGSANAIWMQWHAVCKKEIFWLRNLLWCLSLLVWSRTWKPDLTDLPVFLNPSLHGLAQHLLLSDVIKFANPMV